MRWSNNFADRHLALINLSVLWDAFVSPISAAHCVEKSNEAYFSSCILLFCFFIIKELLNVEPVSLFFDKDHFLSISRICFLHSSSFGARCSTVVRAFAHGAMGRRIDP